MFVKPVAAMNNSRMPLLDDLDRLGLAEMLDSLPPPQRSPAYVRMAQLDRCDLVTSRLLKFFVFGSTVSADSLPKRVVEELEPIVDSGFCMFDDGKVRLANLTLTHIDGLWYFSQMPTPGATLYFGADSLALINRLSGFRGKALDLCSGPGIIGLVLARRGADVVGGEINPIAVSLARLNAVMNGLEDRYSARLGDLYDVVAETEKYDFVVANPPLLPIPTDVAYPFVGNGGPLGVDVIGRLVGECGRVLREDGYLQTLGGTLLRDGNLLWQEQLEELARSQGLRIRVTITGSGDLRSQGNWCRMLAWTILAQNNMEPRGAAVTQLAEELEVGYDGVADEVCFYYLRADRGTPSVSVVNLVGNGRVNAGGWFVQAGAAT